MGAVTISLSCIGVALCIVGVIRHNALLEKLGVFFTMVSLALSFIR